MSKLYMIICNQHTSGLVTKDDVVVEAAPTIKYMKGWSISKVKEYVKEKDWKIHLVKDDTPHTNYTKKNKK